MTAIVAFKGANLPAPAALATSLKSITTGSVGGEVLLKMDKTGHWVYGADQTEIEDKSEWAVNPFSFVHGFIAWGTGEVLAEKMAAITDPLPELDPAPAGSERGWEKQLGFHLRCVSGEDDGLDVRFATTSVGGKRAVSDLAMALAAQVEADPKNIVAVLTLDSEHYPHKKYGRVYTPVFKIVRWISLDGPADAPTAAGAPPAAEAAPETRRRRRV
jgi:hypothetical protein